MCIVIYSFLMGIIGVISFFLYRNLNMIFSKSLTMTEMADAKVMFIILLISICATVLTQALIGVNTGARAIRFFQDH